MALIGLAVFGLVDVDIHPERVKDLRRCRGGQLWNGFDEANRRWQAGQSNDSRSPDASIYGATFMPANAPFPLPKLSLAA
jgi:hypothetical protein